MHVECVRMCEMSDVGCCCCNAFSGQRSRHTFLESAIQKGRHRRVCALSSCRTADGCCGRACYISILRMCLQLCCECVVGAMCCWSYVSCANGHGHGHTPMQPNHHAAGLTPLRGKVLQTSPLSQECGGAPTRLQCVNLREHRGCCFSNSSYPCMSVHAPCGVLWLCVC
jgi:hypothetical protein